MKKLDEKGAKKELEKRYGKAEELLEDKEKTEMFLQKLERKLKTIPVAGEALSRVPILISLVRNYIRKEYTDLPVRSIIAIVSGLIYLLAPVDVIPDVIPGFGYVDDLSVLTFCLKLVGDDVKEYQKWREKNNKVFND